MIYKIWKREGTKATFLTEVEAKDMCEACDMAVNICNDGVKIRISSEKIAVEIIKSEDDFKELKKYLRDFEYAMLEAK